MNTKANITESFALSQNDQDYIQIKRQEIQKNFNNLPGQFYSSNVYAFESEVAERIGLKRYHNSQIEVFSTAEEKELKNILDDRSFLYTDFLTNDSVTNENLFDQAKFPDYFVTIKFDAENYFEMNGLAQNLRGIEHFLTVEGVNKTDDSVTYIDFYAITDEEILSMVESHYFFRDDDNENLAKILSSQLPDWAILPSRGDTHMVTYRDSKVRELLAQEKELRQKLKNMTREENRYLRLQQKEAQLEKDFNSVKNSLSLLSNDDVHKIARKALSEKMDSLYIEYVSLSNRVETMEKPDSDAVLSEIIAVEEQLKSAKEKAFETEKKGLVRMLANHYPDESIASHAAQDWADKNLRTYEDLDKIVHAKVKI